MDEFRYCKEISVRYGDLDTLSHVNNVSYAQYLEEGRGGYYDDVIQAPFEDIAIVIVELHIEYNREIRRDQNVSVALRVPELGTSSVPMEYEIRATDPDTGETVLAATAETTQVYTDSETGRAKPIPDAWREAVAAFEGW